VFLAGERFVGGRWLSARSDESHGWWLRFLGGFVPYYIFVAMIHAVMWIRILPDHLKDGGSSSGSAARFYRRLMIPSKSLVAAAWALMYFRSRDAWTVILQHMTIDSGLVLSVHYSMWS
jgi:hypothetical protein